MSADGADPPLGLTRAHHPFAFRKALEPPQSSEPLAVEFIEAPGHPLCLLESLTALLPAWGHLLLAVVGAGDGPRHGGDGVRVPAQGDAVDEGSLQGVVVLRNVGISVHAAQERVDGSGDGAQRGDAVAWNTPCQHPLGFIPFPFLLQLTATHGFYQEKVQKFVPQKPPSSPVPLTSCRAIPSYPRIAWPYTATHSHPT